MNIDGGKHDKSTAEEQTPKQHTGSVVPVLLLIIGYITFGFLFLNAVGKRFNQQARTECRIIARQIMEEEVPKKIPDAVCLKVRKLLITANRVTTAQRVFLQAAAKYDTLVGSVAGSLGADPRTVARRLSQGLKNKTIKPPKKLFKMIHIGGK